MSSEPVLAIRGLSKSLGGVPVLRDISLELYRGDFCGLIGPNGSGKTTLLLSVAEGSVGILGADVTSRGLDAKAFVGYALQPRDLPPQLSGHQLLDFVASLRSAPQMPEQIRELASQFEMEEKLEEEIGTYSNGMKQKLGVMLALVGTPPLIIMDESLNGLDPMSAFRLKRHLQSLAGTGLSAVLLSSHLLDSLEKYCTRVVMIREGRIEHEWTRAALEAEISGTGRSLEEMFVERMLRKGVA